LLSISIVVYILEPKILKELLSSLTSAINELPQQWRSIPISVIDNGDQFEKISSLLSEFKDSLPGIIYIPTEKNIGYGQAHNLVINKCVTKYHLILNPDVILNTDTLKVGLDFLEENKSVSVIAPQVRNEKQEEQHLCKRYPSIVDLLIRGIGFSKLQNIFSKRLARYECRDKTKSNQPVTVELISGCFMLCRAEHLKKCGGFDKRYFLYFEDFALSRELAKYGFVYYLPTMKIVHYGGNASRKGLRHILMFLSSAIKYFNCNGWKIY
jgi:GT2 family glycosyltransferase